MLKKYQVVEMASGKFRVACIDHTISSDRSFKCIVLNHGSSEFEWSAEAQELADSLNCTKRYTVREMEDGEFGVFKISEMGLENCKSKFKFDYLEDAEKKADELNAGGE